MRVRRCLHKHVFTYAIGHLAIWTGTVALLSRPVEAQTPVDRTRHVSNPVGGLTSPPSAYGSGLMTAPTSWGNNTNLLVTGKVGGAKHFRTDLPYRSTQDFHGQLGSSHLDSFFRLSQNPTTLPSAGVYTPYYSQSRSITQTLPGGRGALSPISRRRLTGTLSQAPIKSSVEISPLPLGPASAPGIMSTSLPYMPYPGDLLGLWRPLDEINADGQLPGLSPNEELLSQQALAKLFEPQQDVDMRPADPDGQIAEIEDVTRVWEDGALADLSTAAQPADSRQGTPLEPLDPTALSARVTPLQLIPRFHGQAQSALPKLSDTGAGDQPPAESESTDDAMPGRADSPGRVAPGSSESLISTHGTLAAYSRARYTQFMQTAEAHLKQGRFAQAISAYKLAALHQPHDPLAAAGRSHALFAQGEFTSSALFLSRALERRPDYAEFLIDLSMLVGGQKVLYARIREAEKYLTYNGSIDLKFLLAYVSFQIGDLSRAQELIDAAQKKQPDHRAVLAIRKAIQKPTKRSK